MNYIIIFCTHWGSQEGGINSFNFDFVQGLGKYVRGMRYRVICIVNRGFDTNLLPAPEANFEVQSLGKADDEFLLNHDLPKIRQIVNSLGNPEYYYFVGHDYFTGELANFFASEYRQISNSVVFHHMSFASYYAMKNPARVDDNRNKVLKQERVLENADLLVGIGPKLYLHARKLAGKEKSALLFPGLQEILIREAEDLNFTLSALTFGRYDERTDNLKQMKLAASAFAEFIMDSAGKIADAKLQIIGIKEDEEAKAFLDNIQRSGPDYIHFSIWPYMSNRRTLFTELSKHNLSMMLSVHEGFGLAGFEAIAAGIPLILSKNSGLFEFLLTIVGEKDFRSFGIIPLHIRGTNDGSVHPDDLSDVKKAINDIWKHIDLYSHGIRSLRSSLAEKYTWTQAGKQFVDIIETFQKKTLVLI